MTLQCFCVVGQLLKNNPLLKLLFPLMGGIALSWLYSIPLLYSLSLFIIALVAMVAGLHRRAPRLLFGVAVSCLMLALGGVVERLDADKMEARWSATKGRFEAQLCESPFTERGTTRVIAEARRIGRDSLPDARREGTVEVTFAGSVALEELRAGDRIFFEAEVSPPKNSGNPCEFDTEHYMYVKGVTGTVYLPVDGWRRMGEGELTLSMRAMRLRDAILDVYRRLGFEGEPLAVLAALTVGEKRALRRDLRDTYSTAGASHILALSGLHLGILYMILSLFLPLRGVGVRVFVREALLLALLWAFAFVGGLSPSVVRAAILFSIMSLGRLLQRDTSSLNSLALAALLMLVVQPRLLFDVSFQLSYSAVAAILLLAPAMRRALGADEGGALRGYIVDIFVVSVASQIGTLPFVWHYFGAFPLYFLLTNLVAVPAAFVVILLAVIMLLAAPVALGRQWVAFALSAVIGWMNGFFAWVASLPAASVLLPYLTAAGVALLSLLMLILFFARGRRRWLWRIASCGAILLLVCAAHPRGEWEAHIIFYNSRSFPAAQLVKSRECSYLLTAYPPTEVETRYIAEPYWRRHGMQPPVVVADAYYRDFSDAGLVVEGGLTKFSGRRIMLLADEHWTERCTIVPVDCIWLCRGFLGSIKELLQIYPSRYVIMDATLYASSRKRIARECREAGVRCIDLSTVGAVKMLCEKTGVRFVNPEE